MCSPDKSKSSVYTVGAKIKLEPGSTELEVVNLS